MLKTCGTPFKRFLDNTLIYMTTIHILRSDLERFTQLQKRFADLMFVFFIPWLTICLLAFEGDMIKCWTQMYDLSSLLSVRLHIHHCYQICRCMHIHQMLHKMRQSCFNQDSDKLTSCSCDSLPPHISAHKC